MTLLRRIRGIAGTALTWALGWTVIAYPAFLVLGSTWPFPLRFLLALKMAAYAGLAGALTGAAFALLVSLRERWPSVGAFPLRHAGKWGALAGAALSTWLVSRGLSNYLEPVAVVTAASITGAILGGASGTLMLAIVQRQSLSSATLNATGDVGARRLEY